MGYGMIQDCGFFTTAKRKLPKEVGWEDVVILSPEELASFDVGCPLMDGHEGFYFGGCEDIHWGFVYNAIVDMIVESTVGESDGHDLEFPVCKSNCKVFLCIEINGKLCKVQDSEWDGSKTIGKMPVSVQLRLYQRLLKSGQITLEDLAAEDIDNTIYKRLVINEIEGKKLCEEKLKRLKELWAKRRRNPMFRGLTKALAESGIKEAARVGEKAPSFAKLYEKKTSKK